MSLAVIPTSLSFAATTPGTVSAAYNSTRSVGIFGPLPNLTLEAINLGGATAPLASVPQLSIQNTVPNAGVPVADSVAFVPQSVMSSASATLVSNLKNELNSGNVVIEWNDGSGNLNIGQFSSQLGLPKEPTVVPVTSSSQSGNIYAVALVKLPNGVVDHVTFTGVDEPNAFGALNLESIWGGLMSLQTAGQSMATTTSSSTLQSADVTPDTLTDESTNVYSYSNVGEVSATDDLSRNRVNDNTKSVWTDHLYYETIPGCVLYSDGQTKYDGDMETSSLGIIDSDASDEAVTATDPNSTENGGTQSVSVGTSGITYSWSWSEGAVQVTNDSDTSEANWSLDYTLGDAASTSTYDAEPGWQMTNTEGAFIFTRNINVAFHNDIFQTGSSYSSETTVGEPDFS